MKTVRYFEIPYPSTCKTELSKRKFAQQQIALMTGDECLSLYALKPSHFNTRTGEITVIDQAKRHVFIFYEV